MQDLERILMEQERDIEALYEKREAKAEAQDQVGLAVLEEPGGAGV